MWGHPCKKSTTVKGRSSWLPRLARSCSRDHEHIILQGSVIGPDGKRVNRTALAAEYSESWCRAYASLQDKAVEERRLLQRC